MTVSQFAPPSMVTTSGSSSRIRRSSASDAACCSNVDVQPTTRAPVARTRRAASSTNAVAAARSRDSSPTRAGPRTPRQTAGCCSLASLICRRYSASSRARSASSPKAAAANRSVPSRHAPVTVTGSPGR